MAGDTYEAARDRLRRAKDDVLWAIRALDDPEQNLEGYVLSQDEKDELYREFHLGLGEVQAALGPLLFKQRSTVVEGRRLELFGPVPPWLAKEPLLSRLRMEGAILPFEEGDATLEPPGDRDRSPRGAIPPFEEGAIPP